MSEEIENLLSPESNESDFQKKFSEKLDQVSLEIPEIERTRPVIEKGMKLIDEEFGLSPELLDKPHALYLMALAQRYGYLEENEEIDKSSEGYMAEKEFIFDATALIAYKSSNLYEKYADLINPEHATDDGEIGLVYDKYTNAGATAELREAVDNGLLDDVKKRLGITAENEDSYQVRVLNVGDLSAMRGLEPYETDSLKATSYNDPARREYNEKKREYGEYRTNLERNARQFKAELGGQGNIAAAWKIVINGVKTIILPLPTVEKILHRDEKCTTDYTDDDYLRDKSILEHEYIHIQGGLNLDENTYIGISSEELRAEKFSSKKAGGYGDIESLDLLMQMINTASISGEIGAHEKGGTADGLFKYLSNKIGLQRTLEFSITPPKSYPNKEDTPLLFSINEHLGGLDGLVTRLYDDAIRAGRADAISDNFEMMANRIAESSPLGNLSYFYDKMRIMDKLPFGAELFRKKFDLLHINYK